MIVRLQQIFKGSGIKIYSKYMYQVSDKLKINDFVTDGKTTLGRIIEKVKNHADQRQNRRKAGRLQ